MDEELWLTIGVYTHSVNPHEVFELFNKLGGSISSYDETSCHMTTQLPIHLIRFVRMHKDVMRIKIITTPYQLREALQYKYGEYNGEPEQDSRDG